MPCVRECCLIFSTTVTRSEFKRGIGWGLTATLVLLTVNGALLLWSKPRYAAEATVRLAGFDAHPEQVVESATEKDSSAIIFKMVEDFANSFAANVVLADACDKLGLPVAMRPDIRSRVRAAPVVGSTFVKITARHEDPQMAQRIVAAFLDARAAAYHQQVEKSLLEKKALTDRLAVNIERQLQTVTDQLSATTRSADFAANITVIEKSLTSIVVERARLQGTLASLEAMSKAGILGDLKDDPGADTFLQEAETLRKWGVIELRRTLASSRSALAETLASSGENSPKILVAKARVAALEHELKSFLQTQIQKERASFAALDQSVKELTAKKAAYETAMLEERQKELAEGPKRALKAGLEASLAETVKAQQLIDLQATSLASLFVVEDPPSLPAVAERPVPQVALLSCPLVGLLIGLLSTGTRRSMA